MDFARLDVVWESSNEEGLDVEEVTIGVARGSTGRRMHMQMHLHLVMGVGVRRDGRLRWREGDRVGVDGSEMGKRHGVLWRWWLCCVRHSHSHRLGVCTFHVSSSQEREEKRAAESKQGFSLFSSRETTCISTVQNLKQGSMTIYGCTRMCGFGQIRDRSVILGLTILELFTNL